MASVGLVMTLFLRRVDEVKTVLLPCNNAILKYE